MFNADLLRNITQMIPTPLKEAVAYAKRHQDVTYVYWKKGFKEGQSISFIQIIQYLITALENNNFYEEGEDVHIYDQFRVQEIGAYTDDIDDAFETLYKFLDLLNISGVFDFSHYYLKSLDTTKQIFGADVVDDEVQRYIDYFNDNPEDRDEDREEDFEESELECKIQLLQLQDELHEKRRAEALSRLQEVLKRLTPKAKGKGK
jgi:hypothetical protein